LEAVTEISERYGRIADGFTTRIDGVPDDRWSSPSPCTDWAARDVAAHVIGTHGRVLATLDETEPGEVDADGDLGEQWAVVRGELESALDDPARASRTVSGMFGEQPFSSLVGRLVCADTLIHTWDLARATGQDERLDPEGVSTALVFLQPIDEAIRRPGGFAAKIEPPADADEQTRLLNFCGRSVEGASSR
jgi:uncharacterized protein (TIGR03086 family)